MTTTSAGKGYVQKLLRGITAALVFATHTKRSLSKSTLSIVIVHNVQIGDMVCTTPVFRAIKAGLPNVRLIVAGSKVNREVIAGNPDVDEYLVYDQSDPASLSRVLREKKIDVGIIPSPSLEGLLVLAFAQIPFIIAARLENGWSPYSTRLYRFLCRFVVTRPHYMAAYAPREYLRLLEPLGIISEDTTKHLSFSSEAAQKVTSLLREEGIQEGKSFVCITPGAGNKIKEWPPERFAEVALHVWKKHQLPIVVIGTAVDQEEVSAMLAALVPAVREGLQLVDTCGRLSIDELKALIASAHLLVGVDTGPIYIAEAFNTPLIDIVGPVGEGEQPPTGKNRIVVVPPGERVPQLHIMNARVYDAVEARRQVMSTTVEMVTQAVDTLLS